MYSLADFPIVRRALTRIIVLRLFLKANTYEFVANGMTACSVVLHLDKALQIIDPRTFSVPEYAINSESGELD